MPGFSTTAARSASAIWIERVIQGATRLAQSGCFSEMLAACQPILDSLISHKTQKLRIAPTSLKPLEDKIREARKGVRGRRLTAVIIELNPTLHLALINSIRPV